MRSEIADIVFPVFRAGIGLRKRLLSRQVGDLEWQTEQKRLQGLLQATPRERDARLDYLGDRSAADVTGAGRSDAFLGIRYALTCWIDEILIQPDIPWRETWNENKLEFAIFGSNERASKFWEQARLARVRPSTDPLEVVYLCIMLGFRGEYEQQPDQLDRLRTEFEQQLTEKNAWTPPPDRRITPNVPPLVGARRKQVMLVWAMVTGLALVFVAVVTFVMKIGNIR